MDNVETGRPKMIFLVFIVVCGFMIIPTDCQNSSLPTTPCTGRTECGVCVQSPECLWCFTNNTCTDYPMSYILPPTSICKLSEARWGVCWVNFEALLIAMAVVGGTILISITVCCCYCCCCCCKSSQSGPDGERFSTSSQRLEDSSERVRKGKAERLAKHKDYRQKYGLVTDSDHPYSKFENE